MFTNIYDRVKDLLVVKPETRDNDNLLLSIIWGDDINNDSDHTVDKYMTTIQFLRMLSENKLTNFESVRRVRQKIQQENPELRGKMYKKRCEELETEARQELKLISLEERFGHKLNVVKEGNLFAE